MQSYGKMVEGNLALSSEQLEGYKPIEYAEIPNFDQMTQYVTQADPVEMDDHIFVGVTVHDLQITNEEGAVDEYTFDMPGAIEAD